MSGARGGRDGASRSSREPAGYPTESEAQRHCARADVVWLNSRTGVYHEQGTPYYGRTKAGSYVCRSDADAAGDRGAKNHT